MATASMFRTRKEHKLLPPPQWLVQDLIPENADIVLYALWGHLKSFVAVDLAYSIVTACTALGLFEVKNPGPVIYFCGEGHDPMAKYRATAWEIAHGFEPYDDPRVQDLHIADGVPPTDKDKLIEEVIEDVAHVLDGQKARLTIIDTMSRALGRQKENDVDVANGYLDTLKKIRSRVGGSTLTLAHAGKDLSRGIRGSSGYGGGFDAILLIDICEKDDERAPYISLLVQKQKDGEDGQRYFWRGRRVPVDEERESLVLDPLTEDEWNTFQFSGGRRTQSVGGTTKEIIQIALEELKPGGGTVTTADLCRKITVHTHQSEATVRKQLERGKKTVFKDYVSPDGKGWCLPGCHLEGCRETLVEQMAELQHEKGEPIFH
jgi:AAA domain-containing protein